MAGLSSYAAVTSAVSAAALLAAHTGIAAASAGVSVAEALLTGQESHADRFQRGIRTMLDDGGWNAPTWRADAAFGVFGSLPLVGVTFDDCFVLLDAVNGGMDGPFATNTYLDARGLLAAHQAYLLNSPIVYYAEYGCPITFGKGWKPWPGPGPAPTLSPPVAGTPPVPTGGLEPFKCTPAPGGGYKCERVFTPTGVPVPPGSPLPSGPGLTFAPPPPTVPARQICTTPAGCEPTGHPGLTEPEYPCGLPKMPGGSVCPVIGPPPGPAPNPCAPTCRVEFWL